jgi:hypothetical protein
MSSDMGSMNHLLAGSPVHPAPRPPLTLTVAVALAVCATVCRIIPRFLGEMGLCHLAEKEPAQATGESAQTLLHCSINHYPCAFSFWGLRRPCGPCQVLTGTECLALAVEADYPQHGATRLAGQCGAPPSAPPS